ncbi:MAG TPA: multiheme c-type cytochrome [Planctomycetota bacterium]|nr:multiheme c-type cytochrome [Planctomycetota bacterium]
MKFSTRIGIVATLLTTLGGIVAFLSSGGGGRSLAQTSVRWESSSQCRDCHADVYAEWLGSHHQIAYTNPEVRALSDDFRKEECMDCHLPRPLAVTGFGKRPLPRRTHFDEGVGCISCHLGPDGGIVGRNDRPEVPCKPQRSETFLAVDTCAACHNQHQTTDQWRASNYARIGTDCAACHMPEVQRLRQDKSARMGRKHVFTGCHDRAYLQTAARFVVAHDGGELVLSLQNVAAGHNFPTEERHRAVDMMYRFVTAGGAFVDGTGEWHRAYRFRMPYRDEAEPINPGNAPGENTQLPAGVTKAVKVPIPAGAAAVEARLWYRLTPFCGDDDPMSTLLDEQKVELR